jgi:indole-3-glycerol phosphate synthase
MSVLDSIIEGVREELALRRKSMAQILEAMDQAAPVRDPLPALLASQMSVIAEVKRASPSKGALASIKDPAALAEQYEVAGAAVISVLTERRRFGGSLDDLGADVILLIVAGISKSQLVDYHQIASELGMRVIIEVHTHDELERALDVSPQVIGVNSRDLKTLEVSNVVFSELIPRIPTSIVRVAESGISSRADVDFAQKFGATAVLVGEALVKAADPITAMRELLGLGRLEQ